MASDILRYNEGKPQLSYILQYGPYALAQVAGVMEMGALKYARNNWKNGGENASLEKLMDSLLRHGTDLLNGETHDKESGKHHAAHMVANAMFILYHYGSQEAGKEK